MDSIHRFDRPTLRRPRAVLAFRGWNDAAESASGAVDYLAAQLNAVEPFALIDPEEFYDFQAHRPHLAFTEEGSRVLTWPSTKFYAVRLPDQERDLVLVVSDEPSFRWKTFARRVTQLLTETDVEQVTVLGAYIGQVAHTSEVPIVGVASHPDLVDGFGLRRSRYEGPTSIVAAVLEACREVGIPALGMWAATPHYLASNPNPKVVLALTRATCEVIDLKLDLSELSEIADDYVQRVDDAVAEFGDFADYVARLESDADIENLDPHLSDALVDEIEEFLRGQE